MTTPDTTVFGGRADGRGPFHAHDGWHFQRDDDGQVLVQHRVNVGGGWHADASVIFDADTWCSIVASVSAGGETGDSFRWARRLHDGTIADG